MPFRKKVLSLVTFSIGLGMLLAIAFGPIWTWVIAIILIGLGARNLFLC